MSEFTEIYIKNKCNEISDEDQINTNKYLPFYSKIECDDLTYLFAYLHYKFNSLFEFINYKVSTNHHYNAEESRSLISNIELLKSLQKALEKTIYCFSIDDDYSKTINACKLFLEASGGSAIPEDFSKVTINEYMPIFNLKPSITVVKDKTSTTKENGMLKTKNNVFIVHGHDNETKQEVARFIEQIGLQAIILHEQASMSMTIIEKIEHYVDGVDFAIILYTPCDKGRGRLETKIPAKNRARQNVVFEHGYLMAKIGRKNVCALVKGDIETPGDIGGVVYAPFDDYGAWKHTLKQELIASGYDLKNDQVR